MTMAKQPSLLPQLPFIHKRIENVLWTGDKYVQVSLTQTTCKLELYTFFHERCARYNEISLLPKLRYKAVTAHFRRTLDFLNSFCLLNERAHVMRPFVSYLEEGRRLLESRTMAYKDPQSEKSNVPMIYVFNFLKFHIRILTQLAEFASIRIAEINVL